MKRDNDFQRFEVTQMTGRGATLFHVRGGKVTRLVVCFDRERAFADLGLSAEDAHAFH